MAKNNKADMSCARVKKYTASDVSKAERHNERKNERRIVKSSATQYHKKPHREISILDTFWDGDS